MWEPWSQIFAIVCHTMPCLVAIVYQSTFVHYSLSLQYMGILTLYLHKIHVAVVTLCTLPTENDLTWENSLLITKVKVTLVFQFPQVKSVWKTKPVKSTCGVVLSFLLIFLLLLMLLTSTSEAFLTGSTGKFWGQHLIIIICEPDNKIISSR